MRAIARLITIVLMVVTVYAMLSFLPFLARHARLHSPTKGSPQYHTLSSVTLFVLVRSNMSEFIDLTGDDSSSDDGSSVNDRHERPRKNGIASSSFAAAAASRHSNDSGDESDDDDKGKIIPYVYAFIS